MRIIETIKTLTIGTETIHIVKIVNPRNTRYAVTNNENVVVTRNTPDTQIVRSLGKAHSKFNKVKNMLDSASKYAYENQF